MSSTNRSATASAATTAPSNGATLPGGPFNGDRRASQGAFETATVLEAELSARIQGEVRFDDVSRMLYSTDASNYQIEPIGVVIPRSADDVAATIEMAASHNVPILTRGGGSSLAGQSVGAALVLDTSKYMNRVLGFHPETRSVTVEPGINLDMLNRHVKAHGLMFGPDPSSSNRATIGGVISNNSAGAHSILYGMTADHIRNVRIQMAGGGSVDLGPSPIVDLERRSASDDTLGRLLRQLLAFRETHHDRTRLPTPLAPRHRLLAQGIPRARRRLQPGATPRLR
jgi:FAD/FMN-containing dehydrogenase